LNAISRDPKRVVREFGLDQNAVLDRFVTGQTNDFAYGLIDIETVSSFCPATSIIVWTSKSEVASSGWP
jgi:hypothetical protein